MENSKILERKKQLSEIRRTMFPMSMSEAEQWRKYKYEDARHHMFNIAIDVYYKLKFDFSDVYSASQDEKIKMGGQFVKNIFRLCFNIYHQQQMLIDAKKRYYNDQDITDSLIIRISPLSHEGGIFLRFFASFFAVFHDIFSQDPPVHHPITLILSRGFPSRCHDAYTLWILC